MTGPNLFNVLGAGLDALNDENEAAVDQQINQFNRRRKVELDQQKFEQQQAKLDMQRRQLEADAATQAQELSQPAVIKPASELPAQVNANASRPDTSVSGEGLASSVQGVVSGGRGVQQGSTTRGLTAQEAAAGNMGTPGIQPDEGVEAADLATARETISRGSATGVRGIDALMNVFGAITGKGQLGSPLQTRVDIQQPNPFELQLANEQLNNQRAEAIRLQQATRNEELKFQSQVFSSLDPSLPTETRVAASSMAMQAMQAGDYQTAFTTLARAGLAQDEQWKTAQRLERARLDLVNTQIAGVQLENKAAAQAWLDQQGLRVLGIRPSGMKMDQVVSGIAGLTSGQKNLNDPAAMAQIPALTNAYYENTQTSGLDGHILIMKPAPKGIAGIFADEKNPFYAVPAQMGVDLFRTIRVADAKGDEQTLNQTVKQWKQLFPGLELSRDASGVIQPDASQLGPDGVSLHQSYSILSNVIASQFALEAKAGVPLDLGMGMAPAPTPAPAEAPRPSRPQSDKGGGIAGRIAERIREEVRRAPPPPQDPAMRPKPREGELGGIPNLVPSLGR